MSISPPAGHSTFAVGIIQKAGQLPRVHGSFARASKKPYWNAALPLVMILAELYFCFPQSGSLRISLESLRNSMVRLPSPTRRFSLKPVQVPWRDYDSSASPSGNGATAVAT